MNATHIQWEYNVFMTQYSESLAENYVVQFEDISMFQMAWKRANLLHIPKDSYGVGSV